MSADGPAIYCGALDQGDQRHELHATPDGLWLRSMRRTEVRVSPWTVVYRWTDAGDESTLLATEAHALAWLLRLPEQVLGRALDAWRQVLGLRAQSREIVLAPSEWTPVDLTAGVPS